MERKSLGEYVFSGNMLDAKINGNEKARLSFKDFFIFLRFSSYGQRGTRKGWG